jgi:heme/copper-type cytochrome/quinol oxidase subunit 1
MIVGFNLTFFPMHFLGVMGMVRRVSRYPIETGFLPLNVAETIGAFLMGISILLFVWNMLASLRRGPLAGNDPWLANTLEWLTSSPPPEYNFASLPRIRSERPLRDLRLAAASAEAEHEQIPPALKSGSGLASASPGH